jgi:tubulin-specific chaperone A
VAYYEQEVKENEATLEEMKAAEKDPYDIKKFKEVLGESYMMIPDSKSRLEQTLTDLGEYIESPEVVDKNLKSDEWYLQAQDLLTKQKEEAGADDAVKETDVADLKEGEAF